jgi:WD40 repeat protein
MDAPADAEPLFLLRGDVQEVKHVAIHPQGSWLATADIAGLAVWPLAREYPVVIRRHEQLLTGLVFAPDGGWLASSSSDRTVRLWPLEGGPPPPGRVLIELESVITQLAVSPDGERLLAGTDFQSAWILSPDGDPPRTLQGFAGQVWGVAFSPDGRLAAAAGGQFDPAERVIRVWDVASGEEVAVLEVGEGPIVHNLQFTADGHLLSASESGLLRWDVESGERELLYEGTIQRFSASADGRRVLIRESQDASDLWGHAMLLELDSGTAKRLDGFDDDVTSVALDPEGTFAVTGENDGEVRVGPVTGGEPHLLLGHESTVLALAIDPLRRWIAAGDHDGVIRLWLMPDLSKPPLHTLPREELIAKLKTLTNLRVVRDEESVTGWKLTHDPFPGWENVPEW